MSLLQPRRFHPAKALWVLAVLVLFTVYTTRRDRQHRAWRWTGSTMGSSYTVHVVDPRLDDTAFAELRRDVEATLAAINDEMSTWLPDSPISRFNRSASTEPFAVSTDFAGVTRLALDVSRASAGAFDITFGPMFALWGFERSGPGRVPDEQAMAATLARCGYRHLEVVSSNQIRKAIPGLQIVFNAIVPGYAAERLAGLLEARGYTNLYVDVGGETVTRGRNPQGQPWRIGIETPAYGAEAGASVEAVVELSGQALATSGDYRNFFTDEAGHVFTHIFDPRTGRPATSRVASVSVVTTNGGLADALATTLFVMGPAEGLPWLAAIPDTEALFIMRESETTLREIASDGFERATGYRPRAGPVTLPATE